MYEIYLDLLKITGKTSYRVSIDTGISQNVIANWKRRSDKDPDASLSLRNMKKLADYFNVSVEYFLRGA